ncbi:MAG TPA: 2-oxoacid:acceptor oxidoreductase family protein [Bacillota bacterium]|nr:2-oxoacid:acceptor oxidoreductase family protein [Bacillota bacterium]
MKRSEIRLSGSGGQGIILAGIILAEAALLEGKNAVQSQSYGPEARGGASKSEVIISSESVDYPKVTDPSLVLALTSEAYTKYARGCGENVVVLVDDSVNVALDKGVLSLPIIRTAREELGRPIVANIVALGAINGVAKLVSPASLEAAVLHRVPKGTEDLNRKALHLGYKLIAKSDS